MTVDKWFTVAWLQLVCINQGCAHPIRTQLKDYDHFSVIQMGHFVVCSLTGLVLTMVGICFKWRGRVRQNNPEEWMEVCLTPTIQHKKGWKSIPWENWFARQKNRLSKSVSASSSNACSPLVPQGDVNPSHSWKHPTNRNTSSTVSSGSSSSRKTQIDYSLNSEGSSFNSKASTATDVLSSASSLSKPLSFVTSNQPFQRAAFGGLRGKLVRQFRDLRVYLSASEKSKHTVGMYADDKTTEYTDHREQARAHIIANGGVVSTIMSVSPDDGRPPTDNDQIDGSPYSEFSTQSNYAVDQEVIANMATLPFDCRDGWRTCSLEHASSFKDIIDPIYSRIPCCRYDQLANESVPSVLTQWSPWQQSGTRSSCASDLERYPSTHIYYELPNRIHHHHQQQQNHPRSSGVLLWQLPDRLAAADNWISEVGNRSPPELPARQYGKSTVDLVEQLRRQVHSWMPETVAATDDFGSTRPQGNQQEDSCLHQETSSVVPMSKPAHSYMQQWCSELDVARLSSLSSRPTLELLSFSRHLDECATSSSVSLTDSLDRTSWNFRVRHEIPQTLEPAMHHYVDFAEDRLSIWSANPYSVMLNAFDSLSSVRHIDSELEIPQQLTESSSNNSSGRPFEQLPRMTLHHTYIPRTKFTVEPSRSHSSLVDTVPSSREIRNSSKGGQITGPRQFMSPLMERSIEDEEARRMLVNVC